MSLCHTLWIYNPNIFVFQFRKSLIFQTYIIWSNRIHMLKYLRSTTLEFKDIGFRKAEFVAKTQFLCFYHILSNFYTERRMQKKRSKTIIFKSLFFDSFFPYMYSLILFTSLQVCPSLSAMRVNVKKMNRVCLHLDKTYRRIV